jgi:3,4-dihydroxy 2-butanone 4-phosphate synthase / GTP cyclohydrolase II
MIPDLAILKSRAMPFSSIPEAIEEFRAGRMLVVVDDEDRENEGDLTLAAEFATPEAINFMAVHGRGLICLALAPERCDALHLPLVSPMNTSRFGTAFCESIDAAEGVTTGISAADRAHTIRTAIRPGCLPSELARPGHVFPLRAREGGVLVRAGQTEAAVDLARLAKLEPRRSYLRNHECGRHHGARAAAQLLLQTARPQNDLGGRPDPLPPSH